MNSFWFKKKNIGWGWYPATWQGWTVFFVYVACVTYRAFIVRGMFDSASSIIFRMCFEVIPPTLALVIVAYATSKKH